MKCNAVIYKRDTYRYTGRGRNGFEMHYTRLRCSRKASHGEWCWQHKNGYSLKYEAR